MIKLKNIQPCICLQASVGNAAGGGRVPRGGRQVSHTGSIDCDPAACKDFEMLTGAPAVQMDLFSRDDYIAFHLDVYVKDIRMRVRKAAEGTYF